METRGTFGDGMVYGLANKGGTPRRAECMGAPSWDSSENVEDPGKSPNQSGRRFAKKSVGLAASVQADGAAF